MSTIKLQSIPVNNNPADYMPSEGLKQALEVAYSLKRPLLLSGEPGTGKTDFAYHVAQQLSDQGFYKEPLVFSTKSSSSAQDLFYSYDAVSHFRKSSLEKEGGDTKDFIELRALGLAFGHAIGAGNLNLPQSIITRSGISATPTSSVVLIDEIDKAPRDFPNDLLGEIERYRFDVKETGHTVQLSDSEKERIIVIMTSNFEKNLPEAFLRRCVYFHIEFPDKDSDVLQKIVARRLDIPTDQLGQLRDRIADFYRIRENANVQKKPSTAEMIDFTRMLVNKRVLDQPLFAADGRVLKSSPLIAFLPALLKKKEDLQFYSNTYNG